MPITLRKHAKLTKLGSKKHRNHVNVMSSKLCFEVPCSMLLDPRELTVMTWCVQVPLQLVQVQHKQRPCWIGLPFHRIDGIRVTEKNQSATSYQFCWFLPSRDYLVCPALLWSFRTGHGPISASLASKFHLVWMSWLSAFCKWFRRSACFKKVTTTLVLLISSLWIGTLFIINPGLNMRRSTTFNEGAVLLLAH